MLLGPAFPPAASSGSWTWDASANPARLYDGSDAGELRQGALGTHAIVYPLVEVISLAETNPLSAGPLADTEWTLTLRGRLGTYGNYMRMRVLYDGSPVATLSPTWIWNAANVTHTLAVSPGPLADASLLQLSLETSTIGGAASAFFAFEEAHINGVEYAEGGAPGAPSGSWGSDRHPWGLPW